jgi:hypothetical protein
LGNKEMKGLDKLVQTWKQQEVELLPPEAEPRVVEVFKKFGVQPSAQVIEMYSMLGGFETMDAQGWRLWTLKDIEAELPDHRTGHGVLFGDYLICCWCFRLRLAAAGEMEVTLDEFDGKSPRVVAKDLASFFDAYVADPDSVLLPNGRAQQGVQGRRG